MKIAILLFSVFISISNIVAQSDNDIKYKTIYSQNFSSSKSLDDFEFADASKWIISKNGKSGKTLKCMGQGSYTNEFGGPSVITILKNIEVGDFVLELDVQQNGKDFDALDFCVLYGIKDQSHYNYAQVSAKADKDNHNIFVLNASAPKRVGDKLEEGVLWGVDEWHHIKVERNMNEKTVKVYFNDKLIIEIPNDDSQLGYIGFGSTKSALKMDNIKLSAPSFNQSQTTIFE